MAVELRIIGVRVAAAMSYTPRDGVAERLLFVALEFRHLPGAEQRCDEGEDAHAWRAPVVLRPGLFVALWWLWRAVSCAAPAPRCNVVAVRASVFTRRRSKNCGRLCTTLQRNDQKANCLLRCSASTRARLLGKSGPHKT